MQYRTDRDYWSQWFPADLISESFPGTISELVLFTHRNEYSDGATLPV